MAIWVKVLFYKPDSRKELFPPAKYKEEDVKKYVYITILFAVTMLFASIAFAEHIELQPTKDEKPGLLSYIKNDWVEPDHGKGFYISDTVIWVHYKEVGLYLRTIDIPEKNSVRFSPAISYQVSRKLYLVGGVSNSSNGDKWYQTGVWYVDQFADGKINVLLDARNYFRAGGNATDYMDDFLEITFKPSEKLTVGINAAWDHWWKSGKDWYLVGPVAYYNITKNIAPFARVSREWSPGNPADTATRYRLGLLFRF
jgi:hypothetical protein